MYNFFIVRVTNRVDGTFGNSVKAYEAEADALREFFRQAGAGGGYHAPHRFCDHADQRGFRVEA